MGWNGDWDGDGDGVDSPAPGVDAEALTGQHFGSFRMVRELGRGGMGAVWLAEHALIQKRVAVKVLHAHLVRDQRLVERFLSEARTLTLIQHPNVVSLFDLNLREGRPYLVMEYLEGQSLDTFAQGPLAPALAVGLLSQVCDALGAAHAHGIVHRDLKPANVFLVPTAQGGHRVKLLDFGIAKLLAPAPEGVTATQSGTLLGTPEYMAPEQCGGERVDGRADLYAAGVLGYLLVTGQLPFTGSHPAEMLLAHMMKPPPLAHEACAAVPPALSRVLVRAMAKRPEDRFASAAELREALQQAVRPEPPAPRPPLTVQVRVKGASSPRVLRGERAGRLGLFLHAEGALPPLLEDVALRLQGAGGELDCMGQVVRHVCAEQAQAWRMSPGFGIQLRDTSAGFLQTFERLLSGEPLKGPVPLSLPVWQDAQVDAVLRSFQGGGDHYEVLGVAKDAPAEGIRRRAREARAVLEPLLERPLSPALRARVEQALARAGEALHTLGHLERRTEYDASLRNLEGLLRCLSEGLTLTALEQCRARFLSQHRVPQGRATLHLATGLAFAAQGELHQALDAYEQALRVDPLHWEVLKRWRMLRAQLRRGTAPTTGAPR
ncbi:protein kinase [Stigmatella sp. ncwal1]|uniref:Protein kinase n=1 Tax=Stigmatella ashevillensis TaxID=2995309 RepID=A0ABT5DF16_9BACT|nr:serine/threonine-protein kinase [Stigmatella ashevillena]MDC0710926.1 protein kinase [Stigmatella ashevillena]